MLFSKEVNRSLLFKMDFHRYQNWQCAFFAYCFLVDGRTTGTARTANLEGREEVRREA